MRVGVEGLGVPLVGGISEHKSLIASAIFSFVLASVDGCHDVGILSLDVRDNLHVGAVKANSVGSETNLTANITSDLLEVNLLSGDA